MGGVGGDEVGVGCCVEAGVAPGEVDALGDGFDAEDAGYRAAQEIPIVPTPQ